MKKLSKRYIRPTSTQAVNLKNTKRKSVRVYFCGTPADVMQVLKDHPKCVAMAAGPLGAINVYRMDSGVYYADRQAYCRTQSEVHTSSETLLLSWLKNEFPKLGDRS